MANVFCSVTNICIYKVLPNTNVYFNEYCHMESAVIICFTAGLVIQGGGCTWGLLYKLVAERLIYDCIFGDIALVKVNIIINMP